MTKIFNGTHHAINIIDNGTFDANIRKHVTDAPNVVASLPSNGVLNARTTTVEIDAINGIPVFGKSFTGVDALPDGFDIYIVSAMFASAARATGQNTSKLFTIADPVYSTDGKTIHGCKGICPFI